MDVWDNTSAGDRGLDQGVQFFVSSDGELQVARRNTLHLQILAGVSGQFQDLGGEVFQDCRRIHGGRGSHSVALVDGILQESMDTTDRELQTGLGTSGLGCLLARRGLSSLSAFSSFSTFAGLRACADITTRDNRAEKNASYVCESRYGTREMNHFVPEATHDRNSDRTITWQHPIPQLVRGKVSSFFAEEEDELGLQQKL